MADARVVIRLAIGDDDSVWVTSVPVNRCYPTRSTGVATAAGEAVGLFIQNIVRDAEIIALRLIEEEHRDG